MADDPPELPELAFGRVGVFGSVCNPPHLGHLILCSEAAWQLGLERVVLVPTSLPPHRPAPAESAEVRYRMAAAAATCEPVLTVSRVELDRPGPSYMVDTLRELARRHAGNELVLLLGADQLAALGRWRDPEAIAQLARIAVAPRPGVELAGLDEAQVEIVRMPLVGISSSLVRARIAAGQPVHHLVPRPVLDVIEAEGLYRPDPAPPRPAPLDADRDDAW